MGGLARETRGDNFSDTRTQTEPAHWLAFVENGRYLRRWFPKCRSSCEWIVMLYDLYAISFYLEGDL